eukprot:m.176251 g.176251  ORF g.176251 m.176251 type:complete len:147 (+) comp53342_c0_seq8:49-489(+)
MGSVGVQSLRVEDDGDVVYVQVVCMPTCFFAAASRTPTLTSLATAIPALHGRPGACSQLIGSVHDPTSSSMATRLAKRTGQQCFLSLDVPVADGDLLLPKVEKAILTAVLAQTSVREATTLPTTTAVVPDQSAASSPPITESGVSS